MIYMWLGECIPDDDKFNSFIWDQNILDVVYDKEWFDDLTVKSLIKDVDKNTVVNGPLSILSPVFGPMTMERLSGGVKTLILSKFAEVVLRGSGMGENCIPWLGLIGTQTNVYMNWNWTPNRRLMEYNEYFDFPVYFVNNGKTVSTFYEFMRHLAFNDKESYVYGSHKEWEDMVLGTSKCPAVDSETGKVYSNDYISKKRILEWEE